WPSNTPEGSWILFQSYTFTPDHNGEGVEKTTYYDDGRIQIDVGSAPGYFLKNPSVPHWEATIQIVPQSSVFGYNKTESHFTLANWDNTQKGWINAENGE